MGSKPTARDEGREWEVKYSSHFGLGYRQRRKGYRWQWGINVVAGRVLAAVGIFDL